MDIKAYIQTINIEDGLTQKRLGEMVGISEMGISYIERGKKTFKNRTCKRT